MLTAAVAAILCCIPFQLTTVMYGAVKEVAGGPEGVVCAVQLSHLHFSVHAPDRARDFARHVASAISIINPSLVLITGDFTDGKREDLLTMKQDEVEWIENRDVIDDVARRSGSIGACSLMLRKITIDLACRLAVGRWITMPSIVSTADLGGMAP